MSLESETNTPVAPAHSVARFNLAQGAVWLAASRRRLQALSTMDRVSGLDDGILLAGEAWQGILAFEQALLCARWVVANDSEAGAALPPVARGDGLDRIWANARAVRNHVLVHFDSWVARDPTAKVVVDSVGLHASNGLALGYAEWNEWLLVLEPWARAQLTRPPRPSHQAAVRPSVIPIGKPPEPEAAMHPPAGSVWFGSSFDPGTFQMEGRSEEVAAGRPVGCVGRLETSIPAAAIRVLVSKPDGSLLFAAPVQPLAPGSNVAAVVLRGLNQPGQYVVTFATDEGEALAEGLIRVTPAMETSVPTEASG
jgi:hypothetical protein